MPSLTCTRPYRHAAPLISTFLLLYRPTAANQTLRVRLLATSVAVWPSPSIEPQDQPKNWPVAAMLRRQQQPPSAPPMEYALAAASSRCGDEICTRQPAECGHGCDGKPPCCEVQPAPMASRRAAAAAQARLSVPRRRCRGGQASRVTSRLLCAPGACRARETGCAVKTAICSLSGRPAGQRPEPASERRKSSALRSGPPLRARSVTFSC